MTYREEDAEIYRQQHKYEEMKKKLQRGFTEADMMAAVRTAALKEAAEVASNACLVPPDGGSPSEVEREVCEVAAARILALIPTPQHEVQA